MVHRKNRRLLQCNPNLVPDGGCAVVSSLTALTLSYSKDPAGHIFHHIALKQAGLLVEEDTDDDQTAADSFSEGPSREGSTADFSSLLGAGATEDEPTWRKKGKKKSSKKKRDAIDLYALLGLQHERWMATDSQIKAAHRRSALEHHPDKQRQAAGDDENAIKAAEERFKAIQEAYETLCDPVKRREYDSLDTFDDSLPGEAEASSPDAFFKHFGAAFMRNSRWAINQPAPSLGDDTTDMEHVEAFYDYWFSFKSWREFPHADEEDIESAESREERRWIERYNSKLREKGKKEEFRRLRDFVELAHKMDPRIQKRKEEQRAERERQKLEREAERLRKQEEEQKKKEEEERAKIEEEAAAAEHKKQRQVEKKALQKERARLRKLCGTSGGEEVTILPGASLDIEHVELLCSNLDFPTLNALCNAVSSIDISEDERSDALHEQLRKIDGAIEETYKQRQAAAAAAAAAIVAAAKAEDAERRARLEEWKEEEVRLMQKALDKFPQGTMKRWEQVQAYVRTRTLDEVLEMAKHGLKSGKYSTKTTSGLLIAKKRQGNTVIHSEATQRIDSFTDVDVSLRGEAAQKLNSEDTDVGVNTQAVDGGNSNGGTSGTLPRAGVDASGGAGKDVVPPVKDASSSSSSSSTANEKKNDGTTPSLPLSTSGTDWTSQEEVVLVKALKDIPKDAADRWDRVAATVGTKSKTECARKFKEMKQSYKAKKGG